MNPVVACSDHLIALIKDALASTIDPALVVSEKDLLKRNRIAEPPFIGVVYQGMFVVPDGGNQGNSKSIVMSVIVAYPEAPIRDEDKRLDAITDLHTLRMAVKSKKSPTGHFWKFQQEAPAQLSSGHLIWVQRWSTAFVE